MQQPGRKSRAFQSKSTFFTMLHFLGTAEPPRPVKSRSEPRPIFPSGSLSSSCFGDETEPEQSLCVLLCHTSFPQDFKGSDPFIQILKFSPGAFGRGWRVKCCFGKDETTLAVFIFNSGDLVRKIFLKNGRKSNYALTKCGLLIVGKLCSWSLFPGVDVCSSKLPLGDERESFNISSHCLSFLPALSP